MRSPRNAPVRVQHTALDHSIRIGGRHGAGKIEKAAWFGESEIHVRSDWIRDDAFDPGDRQIAPDLRHFPEFVIYDPIAEAGLDASQIWRAN